MAGTVRTLLVLLGIAIMVLSLIFIGAVPDGRVAGLVWVAIGGFLVVVVLLERERYRSEAAERTNAQPGPGGGERTGEILDPRFRPTAEAFVDPTTGHRMRVLVDPATGERRYVAEA